MDDFHQILGQRVAELDDSQFALSRNVLYVQIADQFGNFQQVARGGLHDQRIGAVVGRDPCPNTQTGPDIFAAWLIDKEATDRFLGIDSRRMFESKDAQLRGRSHRLVEFFDQLFRRVDRFGTTDQQQSVGLVERSDADLTLASRQHFGVQFGQQFFHRLTVDVLQLVHHHFRLGDRRLGFDFVDHILDPSDISLAPLQHDNAQFRHELNLHVADQSHPLGRVGRGGFPFDLCGGWLLSWWLRRAVASLRQRLLDRNGKRRVSDLGDRCGVLFPKIPQQPQCTLNRRGLRVLNTHQLRDSSGRQIGLVERADHLLPTRNAWFGREHRHRVGAAVDLDRRSLQRLVDQLEGGDFAITLGRHRDGSTRRGSQVVLETLPTDAVQRNLDRPRAVADLRRSGAGCPFAVSTLHFTRIGRQQARHIAGDLGMQCLGSHYEKATFATVWRDLNVGGRPISQCDCRPDRRHMHRWHRNDSQHRRRSSGCGRCGCGRCGCLGRHRVSLLPISRGQTLILRRRGLLTGNWLHGGLSGSRTRRRGKRPRLLSDCRGADGGGNEHARQRGSPETKTEIKTSSCPASEARGNVL